MTRSPVVSVSDLPRQSFGNGGRFGAEFARIGPVVGMQQLGAMYTVVEPGMRAFPFHRHHIIEEAMVILEGEGEYRYGETVYPVKPGDVIAAPAGAQEAAHQLINSGDTTLKYICFSTQQKTDVVEYPDSGKVGAITWAEEEDTEGDGVLFRHRAYQSDPVDYWEGEE